ncbi:MAG: WbqC family protein [Flavobacteriales bacterium]|nr:WbqC family protein [Flavobacteriales bacterium]
MTSTAIFSSYYLAPISFYHALTQFPRVYTDVCENFVKQTYRSRTYMMGPNGVQILTIPLTHIKKRQRLKDIRISYAENWQKIHWKSIEAGYRRSAYFEYYEDHFYPVFHKQTQYLLDFNETLQHKVLELLSLDVNITHSDHYLTPEEGSTDFRSSFTPKSISSDLNFPEYYQVFSDRNPFAPNLSIIDLLFNEGPNALNYLKSISK